MTADPRSDEELIAAARQGDRAAVTALLSRHEQQIYRFGLRMCRHPEDAKEVLQETLLAMARSLPEFRAQSSVATWLYTIARSFCIKQRRLRQGEPAAHAPLEAAADVAAASASPEEAAASQEVDRAVEGAIAELAPEYREVLVLRDAEGLTAPEVAEVLGISVDAVKSRLHRARLAVRARVAPLYAAVAGATAAGAPGAAAASPPSPGCPDVAALLSRHLEGDITADVCATMEGHLAGCARCRAVCDSLRDVLARCRRAGDDGVPPAVQQRVRVALQDFLRPR